MSQQFVNPDNTRSEEQRAVYDQIIKDGVCPFCQENFLKYHTKPILKEGAYWIFTKSAWPYKGTKQHFLIVLKRHAERIEDLTPEEGAELITMSGELITEREVAGGALAMRFGKNKNLKNSVAHIHAQLIEPNVDEPNHQGVKLPISKKVE
ncbi:MAG: HIT domain-containing protein [Patescibacteria group bacterium]